MTTHSLVEQAFAHIDLGFKVFSVWSTVDGHCRCPLGRGCASPGKHPIPPDGFHAGSRDHEAVRTMLSAGSEPNYGVVWPDETPEVVFVIDVDGPDWRESIARLKTRVGVPLPTTKTTRTPSGGLHIYYRWPKLIPMPKLGKMFGFVTRWPDKGYVVGPGSADHRGQWMTVLDEPIAVLPSEWALEATRGPLLTVVAGGPAAPETVSAGSRHDYLRDRARTLRGGGLTGEDLFAAVSALNARLPEPKTADEVRRAIGDVETKFAEDPLPGAVEAKEVEARRAERKGIVIPAEYAPDPLEQEWLVTNLLRPRALCIIASEEGLGKSMLRLELSARLALGEGQFLGVYPIQRQCGVLVFDEENGESEEYRRLGTVLDCIGSDVEALGGNYGWRSFGGFQLDNPVDQQLFEDDIYSFAPHVVVIDTGGAMLPDEWGKDFKRSIAFIRRMQAKHEFACVIVVHMTKPQRQTGRIPVSKQRVITDVMGQWTRPADVVVLLSPTDDETRIRLDVRKRVPQTSHILAMKGGVWESVEVLRDAPVITVRADKIFVLDAVRLGATTSGDIVVMLEKWEGAPKPSRATLHRWLKDLVAGGLLVATPDAMDSIKNVYVLTKDGKTALLPPAPTGVVLNVDRKEDDDEVAPTDA